MNRRKDLCRNFQRGSCQYGDRCKFLHMTQQQQKPCPFGFGVQNTSPFLNTNQQHQQQKSNPFGFGVQNASQSRGASNIGGHYLSQPQPFVNKWTRSSTSVVSTKTSKQGDALQVVVHKCTDPESCKRQITDDFNQERPLWRLTCYGHSRGLPCDIVGDVSYEELQATAYEDARRGLSLQTIVERERNLLNSKLMEFDNFLRSPYGVSQGISSTGPSFVPAINHSSSSVDAQRHMNPSFSSFSQPGASANVGPTIRPPSLVNQTFGLGNSFQVHTQTSNAFEMKLGTSDLPFGTSPAQSAPNFSSGSTTTQSSPFFHPVVQSMQVSSSSAFSLPGHVDGHRVAANVISQPPADGHQMENRQEIEAGDFAIWLKEEWEIGEVTNHFLPNVLTSPDQLTLIPQSFAVNQFWNRNVRTQVHYVDQKGPSTSFGVV